VLVCPTCRAGNHEDATFCAGCDGSLAPSSIVTTKPQQESIEDIELQPFRKRKSDAALVVALIATGVLGYFTFRFIDPEPEQAVTVATAEQASPAPKPALGLSAPTLDTMAHSGAVSLATNMANGNTEVVQAIMTGPYSLRNATGCNVGAVFTPIFDNTRETRLFNERYDAAVSKAVKRLDPVASGEAAAWVPEEAPRLMALGSKGQELEARAVRVTVLLYGCK
jgi:hypothetical protein